MRECKAALINFGRLNYVYFTKTTLIALIKAVTWSPSTKPTSSKDSRVITDAISVSPIHIVTWAMTPSAFIFQTLPRS
jgi:hypothetical protein